MHLSAAQSMVESSRLARLPALQTLPLAGFSTEWTRL